MKKINILILALIMVSCNKERPAPLSLHVVAMQHNICFGADVAFITVQANGGFPAYLYRMDNGQWQKSNTFNHVPSGGHYMKVRDGIGNTAQCQQIVVGVSAPACNTLSHDQK